MIGLLLVPLVCAQTLDGNRSFDALQGVTDRQRLWSAAWALEGEPPIELAGVDIDAADLARWASSPDAMSLTRVIREDVRRAVDVDDLLYLLDDVVSQRPAVPVVLPAGRARSAGLLVHPTDVFTSASRTYEGELAIDRPTPQRWVLPAEDGDPLGVRWTTRFANPETTGDRLDALTSERGSADFAERVALLGAQLEAQGATVWLTSTARDPRRGYLLWGSFILSRQTTEAGVASTARLLRSRRTAWGLDVPIVWEHPDGWQATVRAATEMAETYDVVYATERGARSSNHYGGRAVDIVALGLPERVVLWAPDGAMTTFDLTDGGNTRDLSLQPEMIRWIEVHFGLRKLDSDYPHWSDTQ